MGQHKPARRDRTPDQPLGTALGNLDLDDIDIQGALCSPSINRAAAFQRRCARNHLIAIDSPHRTAKAARRHGQLDTLVHQLGEQLAQRCWPGMSRARPNTAEHLRRIPHWTRAGIDRRWPPSSLSPRIDAWRSAAMS